MRFKRIGNLNDLVTSLLSEKHLAGPIEGVVDAGCEVRPEWTSAVLLVPLTQGQVEELGVELSVHHILTLHHKQVLAAQVMERCAPSHWCECMHNEY